jgi:hypothetical protein
MVEFSEKVLRSYPWPPSVSPEYLLDEYSCPTMSWKKADYGLYVRSGVFERATLDSKRGVYLCMRAELRMEARI